MLLCTWLSNCPIAVTHFLHNSANVPFLTGQIAENLGEEEQLVQGLCALLLGISIYFNDNSLENYVKEKLKQLIEKRIGKENFIEKLGFISKHELYSRASQKPQPNFPSPEYMIFDHEFTKLVKELEGVITKAIYKSSEEDKKEEEVKKTLEQHDNIVTHYKNMIREQDLQLEDLKQQVSTLKCQNEQLQTAVTQQVSQIQQHKDQYNLLKIQLGKDNHHQGSYSDGAQMNGIQPEEISRLREEIDELKSNQELLQSQLAEKDSLIENLKSQTSGMNEQSSATASVRDSEQVAELKQEVAALKAQLNSKSVEITRLQTEKHDLLQKTEAFSKSVPVQGDSENVIAGKTTDVEGRLSALQQETKELKNEIKALSEERTAIKEQLDSSNSTIAILQNEKDKLESEIIDSKKEQDDLLVLLADQDQKILSLKSKLKDLGHPVEEEDELESGDQEDEDEENEDVKDQDSN
ncbi:general vesicular transport factor p115 isoform 2-T2 [Thomomys bottae]